MQEVPLPTEPLRIENSKGPPSMPGDSGEGVGSSMGLAGSSKDSFASWSRSRTRHPVTREALGGRRLEAHVALMIASVHELMAVADRQLVGGQPVDGHAVGLADEVPLMSAPRT